MDFQRRPIRNRPSQPEDLDDLLYAWGLITEEERRKRAWEKIHRDQLRRRNWLAGPAW